MSRSKRMRPLIDVAATHEREAAGDLGDILQLLEKREAQLLELRGYREDYAKRLEGGGTTLGAQRLQECRAFLLSLNRAIIQQEGLVEKTRQELEAARTSWMSRRRETRSLDTVADRYRAQEYQEAEYREQRELDERNQRIKK